MRLSGRPEITICFAHAAYRLGQNFAARHTGIRWVELCTPGELAERIGEADVLVEAPVVVTAYGDAERRRRACECGATEFLTSQSTFRP